MNMNRLNLLILGSLKAYNSMSIASAVTLYEVKEFAKLTQSTATINRAAIQLYELGYIAYGVKDSKAYTYFITQSGLELLKEVK